MPVAPLPLHDAHAALGAHFISCAGWQVPAWYRAGALAEEAALARGAGVVDLSHLAQFELVGPDRHGFLNHLATNDIARVPVGGLQRTLLVTGTGGIAADLLVYRFRDRLLLVTAGGRRGATWDRLVEAKRVIGGNVRLRDVSDAVGCLAVIGAEAERVAERVTPEAAALRDRSHARVVIDGVECFVAREAMANRASLRWFCRARDAAVLWARLLRHGAAPLGATALEALRIHAGTPRMGAELDETVTPWEAGLGGLVVTGKGARFPGEEACAALADAEPLRRLVRLTFARKTLARRDTPIRHRGREAGVIASSAVSALAGAGVALAFLPTWVADGATVEAGRHGEARVERV